MRRWWRNYFEENEALFRNTTSDVLSEKRQARYLRFVAEKFRAPWLGLCAIGLLFFVVVVSFVLVGIGIATGPAIVTATFMATGLERLSKIKLAEKERLILSRIVSGLSIRPAHCIVCNYSLQGSVSESCPECGEPLAKAQHANPTGDQP